MRPAGSFMTAATAFASPSMKPMSRLVPPRLFTNAGRSG
jgi:hypothetical protein